MKTFRRTTIVGLVAMGLLMVLSLFGCSDELENAKEKATLHGCSQYGRVVVGGSDKKLGLDVFGPVDTATETCIEFTAVLNGQSAYIMVDTSAGFAPDGRLGFKRQEHGERGLDRYVHCFLNANDRLEVPVKVGIERNIPGGSAADTFTWVNVGVYPIAENETCAGWNGRGSPIATQ